MRMHKSIVIFIIMHFRYSESVPCDNNPKNTEAKLMQDLLCSYDKDSRPTADHKNATIVNLQLYIKKIAYEEHTNELTVHSWANMKWSDHHLKWNPAEYDGINNVVLHGNDIWMPDFSLYNSESSQFHESCTVTHCYVENDGVVTCLPPCLHSVKCKTNYFNWPYDVQKCSLHFGTWMNRGEEVMFKEDRTSIDSTYMDSNEWRVLEVKVHSYSGNYSCCPNETFPSIKYLFTIQRHSASDMMIVFTPAIVLAVVNLFVIWLSPSSSERMVLISVSLMSHFLFMQYLSWLVPKNGNTAPSILVYFRDSLVITVSVLIESLIMRGMLAWHSDTPVWVQSLTKAVRGNKIGQLVFINPYILNNEEKATIDSEALTADDSANLIEGQLENREIEAKPESKTRLWFSAVTFFDTLFFLVLIITYATMIFGWLPNSRLEQPKADLIEEIDE